MARIGNTPDSGMDHIQSDDDGTVASAPQLLIQQFQNTLQNAKPEPSEAHMEKTDSRANFMNKELAPIGSDAMSPPPMTRRLPELAAPDTIKKHPIDHWRYVRGIQANN